MPDHDSRAIANEFIELASANGTKLTHMALQKLVYIAHGWNFALNESEGALICDEIQAWDWGPVIPTLWDSLKRYGNRPVDNAIRSEEWRMDPDMRGNPIREALSPNEQNIVRLVFENYGSMGGGRLSEITHENGTPWSTVYKPGVRHIRISDDDIRDHYLTLKRQAAA